MAFTQTLNDKKGLNPSLQSPAVTGETYVFHQFGSRRVYFGSGNPAGEVSALPGSVAFTEEGIYFCNGDGAGGTGSVWFSTSNEPLTATVEANVEKTVSHTLGHVAQVWAVDTSGNLVDVDVTDISTSGFKVTSLRACTVYYR